MDGPMAGERRILFIARDADAASTRYRAEAFFAPLRRAGWEPSLSIQPRRLTELPGILKEVSRAEVCVVCRTPSGWFWRAVRAFARRLVVDYDDAVFLRDDGTESFLRRRRFTSLVRAADAVWAGNDYLAEFAESVGQKRIAVVPTSVDPQRYPAIARDRSGDADHVDLVWIGTSSTRRYLEARLPDLEAAQARDPRLRLRIVSDFTLESDRLPIIAEPWTEATEARSVSTSDIGISPSSDDPWTRGKCGLKTLQYMAARLPVVASDVGVHRSIVLPNRTGVLVGDDGWTEAILRLAADPVLRRDWGVCGRKRLETAYSREIVAERIGMELDRLARNGRRAA